MWLSPYQALSAGSVCMNQQLLNFQRYCDDHIYKPLLHRHGKSCVILEVIAVIITEQNCHLYLVLVRLLWSTQCKTLSIH